MDSALNSANISTRISRRSFGRLSADQLKIRKESILRAAVTLFTEHGFIEASRDDIARNAGVSTRAIYSHYDNRAGLVYRDADGSGGMPAIESQKNFSSRR